MGTKSLRKPWIDIDDRTEKVVDVAYIDTPVANATLSTTYEKMNGSWLDPQIEGFIINGSGHLQYDSDVDLDLAYWAAGQFKVDTVNKIVTVAIEHAGNILPGSATEVFCKTANEPFVSALISGKASVTKGDVIKTVIKIDSGTQSVIGDGFTFIAMKAY